jgi:hypothetical protein
MLQGYSDTVLRAEALEEELAKAMKHSAMFLSKLDGAGHAGEERRTGAQEQVAPQQEQNKGTLLSCRVPIGSTLQ